MSRVLAVLCLLPLALGAAKKPDPFVEPERIDVTDGWQMQTADADSKAPAADGWRRDASLRGYVPMRGGGQPEPETAYKSACSAWYRRTLTVSAKWKGSVVAFEQDVHDIDVDVYVNGKLAGTAFAPAGFVDLSAAVAYGRPNEILLFASNRGERYRARDDSSRRRHFCGAASVTCHTPAYVEDVFVDTSVRRTNAVLRCKVRSVSARDAELSAEIAADDTGKVVKKAKGRYKLVQGLNDVELVIPWQDPVCWEPGRPYLYRLSLAMKSGRFDCETPRPVLFGFRELWRDKGQFILNGHVLSVRGFWSAGIVNPGEKWANFKAAGYNAIYETHQHESLFRKDPRTMEALARAGLMMFIGAPAISMCADAATSSVKAPQYRRYVEHWARSVRNWPSVIGVSVGVNMVCAAPYVMGPNDMGRGGGGNGNILAACRLVKELHPNCLAFCHGDGNLCDVGCCNFYFNFTPLQERLEWYSSWYDRRNREDTLPFYPCEYGQPYYGSWFGGGVPTMTEWCAIYYGEDAYRAEKPEMLRNSRMITYSKLGNWFGGWDTGPNGARIPLHAYNPKGDELHTRFVQEVGRAWRAWHCRMAPMYLDDVDFSPAAANTPEFRAHAKYNHDLCVFLAGRPDAKRRRFADQAHAFWSGTVRDKSVVAVWDGLGSTKVDVSWALKGPLGKTYDSGHFALPLKTGDVVWQPITIHYPTVKAKTRCRLEATFSAPQLPADERTDAMELEVYPPFEPVPEGGGVAIYDPLLRDTTKMFESIGLKCRQVRRLSDLAGAPERHLVISRRALDAGYDSGLDALERRVRDGGKLMIMSQSGDTWRRLGFETEDAAPRILYNWGLKGVEPDELRYWGGSPLPARDGGDWHWGPDWGPSQSWHRGTRGWRWTHTHALSLTALLIPQRTLFRPLLKGEFDMAYSSLMRADIGKGSLVVCNLDFEGRVGPRGDPAPTKVLMATLREFFTDAPQPTRRLYCSGKDAARLAECLGFEAVEFSPEQAGPSSVLLAGADSPMSAEAVKSASAKGTKVLAVAADRLAKDLGFKFAPAPAKSFCRVTDTSRFSKFPYDGVGLSLLRWRESPRPNLLASRAGWTVAGDGVFAISSNGNVLLDQVPPFRVLDERVRGGAGNKGDPSGVDNCTISLDNNLRRHSLVLLNWGVEPPERLVRRVFSAGDQPLYWTGSPKYDAYGYVYW